MRSLTVPLAAILGFSLACSAETEDKECGEGTHDEDGTCVANPPRENDADTDVDSDTDADSDTDTDTDTDADTNDPPSVLSFGANVPRVPDGGSVTFTAVVTDPDGIDDLIGGQLTTETGVPYGSFSADSAEGSYEITLTWDDLEATEPIEFDAAEQRSFTAEFWDQSGARTTASVTLDLYCSDGGGYCDGACVDLSSSADHCGTCSNACNPGGACGEGVCHEFSDCLETASSTYVDCDDYCAQQGDTCNDDVDACGMGATAWLFGTLSACESYDQSGRTARSSCAYTLAYAHNWDGYEAIRCCCE